MSSAFLQCLAVLFGLAAIGAPIALAMIGALLLASFFYRSLILACVLDAATILLFVINATTGAPLRDMIIEIWPFLIALLGALLTITLVPEFVLWLPMQLGYAP